MASTLPPKSEAETPVDTAAHLSDVAPPLAAHESKAPPLVDILQDKWIIGIINESDNIPDKINEIYFKNKKNDSIQFSVPQEIYDATNRNASILLPTIEKIFPDKKLPSYWSLIYVNDKNGSTKVFFNNDHDNIQQLTLPEIFPLPVSSLPSTSPGYAPPTTDDDKITGFYKSDSDTAIPFEITQDKINSDKFIVSLTTKSEGIATATKSNGLSFEITQIEFDNFKTNILDRSTTWSVTINGVPTDVPGKWATKTTAVLPTDPITPPKAPSTATTDATTGSEINSFLKKTTNTRPSKIMFSTGLNDFTPLDILLQFVDTYDSSKIPQGDDTIFSFGGTKKKLLNIPDYDISKSAVFFDLFSDMLQLNIGNLIGIFKLGNPIITAMIRNILNSYQNLKPSDDVSHLAILKAQLNSVVLMLQESDIDSTKFGIHTESPTFYDPANKNSKVVTTGKITYTTNTKQVIKYKIIEITRTKPNDNLYIVCVSSNIRLPDELIEPVFTAGLNVNSYEVKIHGNTGIPKNSIKFIISEDDFRQFMDSDGVMNISINLSGSELTSRVTFDNLSWEIDQNATITDINLLKCSKLTYFKKLNLGSRNFFSSQEEFKDRNDELQEAYKKKSHCFKPYLDLFGGKSDIADSERLLLSQSDELFNLLYDYVDFIKIYAQAPYKESILVNEITDLFNNFKFSNIKVGEFPFPFIVNFLKLLLEIIEKLVLLFTNVFSHKYDSLNDFDLSNFKYLSLKLQYSVFTKKSFITWLQLTLIFAQAWPKFFDLLDSMNKGFYKDTTLKEHFNTDQVKETTGLIGQIKKNKPSFDDLLTARELRIRKDATAIQGLFNEISELMATSSKGDSEVNSCDKFKKQLKSFADKISDTKVTNEKLLQSFNELIDAFINLDNCIDDDNKRKIYNLLKSVSRAFAVIEPNQQAQLLGKMLEAKTKLSTLQVLKNSLLKTGDKNLQTLQRLVYKLDDIFTKCTTLPVTSKTLFVQFKDKLSYTNISQEDIDRLDDLKGDIDSNTKTICSDKDKEDMKSKIINKLGRIRLILQDFLDKKDVERKEESRKKMLPPATEEQIKATARAKAAAKAAAEAEAADDTSKLPMFTIPRRSSTSIKVENWEIRLTNTNGILSNPVFFDLTTNSEQNVRPETLTGKLDSLINAAKEKYKMASECSINIDPVSKTLFLVDGENTKIDICESEEQAAAKAQAALEAQAAAKAQAAAQAAQEAQAALEAPPPKAQAAPEAPAAVEPSVFNQALGILTNAEIQKQKAELLKQEAFKEQEKATAADIEAERVKLLKERVRAARKNVIEEKGREKQLERDAAAAAVAAKIVQQKRAAATRAAEIEKQRSAEIEQKRLAAAKGDGQASIRLRDPMAAKGDGQASIRLPDPMAVKSEARLLELTGNPPAPESHSKSSLPKKPGSISDTFMRVLPDGWEVIHDGLGNFRYRNTIDKSIQDEPPTRTAKEVTDERAQALNPFSFKSDNLETSAQQASVALAKLNGGKGNIYNNKKQKRSTTKKQNNNRHNIKKKRTSVKKNKKRIVTRNTRRRIFE